MGPEGVLNITGAMIASRIMRRTAVELLKVFDTEGYETYKKLKFVLDPIDGQDCHHRRRQSRTVVCHGQGKPGSRRRDRIEMPAQRLSICDEQATTTTSATTTVAVSSTSDAYVYRRTGVVYTEQAVQRAADLGAAPVA